MPQKTIMLVEDNLDDLDLLQRAFKKCCISSKNGRGRRWPGDLSTSSESAKIWPGTEQLGEK